MGSQNSKSLVGKIKNALLIGKLVPSPSPKVDHQGIAIRPPPHGLTGPSTTSPINPQKVQLKSSLTQNIKHLVSNFLAPNSYIPKFTNIVSPNHITTEQTYHRE